MNTLIPAPDAIPVSWGYFKFLLMPLFPGHNVILCYSNDPHVMVSNYGDLVKDRCSVV